MEQHIRIASAWSVRRHREVANESECQIPNENAHMQPEGSLCTCKNVNDTYGYREHQSPEPCFRKSYLKMVQTPKTVPARTTDTANRSG